MPIDLSQNKSLTLLESSLKHCLHIGDYEGAVKITKEIQGLFLNDKKNHRLLRAKLWSYEVALLVNKNAQAAAGLEDLLKSTNRNTKLRLDTQVLLTIACLRQKNLPRAKLLIQEVFSNVNDIKSETSRQLFLKKLLERLEEECILSGLTGSESSALNINEVHAQAIVLIQNNSDSEILVLMAESLPEPVLKSLRVIRGEALLQVSRPDDIKALGSGNDAEKPKALGSRVFGVFKRVIWKSVCSPQSTLFKMWNNKLPEVFGPTYLTAAVVASLKDWGVGTKMIAAGLTAVLMKASAQVFCEDNKPESFMTERSEIKSRSKKG